MDITVVGTQRFRVVELDSKSRSYLSAQVRHYPAVNGSTKLAADLAQKVRPRIVEYVELLSEASNQKLQLDRLPDHFLARVTEDVLGLGIDQHDAALAPDDDHGIGGRFQQGAETLLGALLFGDVAADGGGADQLTAGGVDGRDGQRDVEVSPVLGHAHCLEVLDMLAAADASVAA